MLMLVCDCSNFGKILEGSTGHTSACNRLQRKAATEAAKPPKKKKPIAKVGKKMKAALLTYSKRRRHHLNEYPECQLKLDGCTKEATQIHHTAGRIGSLLTNKRHFKSACGSCHRQLHDKLSAKEARRKGLKV